ncbi:putative membrane protein [Kaistia hirudinis]|uniref:Putative membrane protein n=1 Tax=Kaistia hirudinis TaxID=1293440 RepID=A0A840AWA5_9HYPH|nr:putative membrane protein [Kaistia hirudinis]
MDDLVIARILHVLGVVHWIGGLAFVTLVILPLARRRGADGVALFEAAERRFSGQVRLSVLLVGASGFWMTWRMEAWDRLHDPASW